MLNRIRNFFRNYEYPLIAWIAIALIIFAGVWLGIDRHVLGAIILLVGILGQAFSALIAWIGLVPLIGPIVAKVLSLPFIWILNGVGYLASIVAIRRGYSRDVVNYRVITVTLLIGITLGYILGKFV